MFAFYKVVKRLILPPTSILLLLLLGYILCLVRLRRLGKVVLGLGILLFYLLSIAPTADLLLWPLESLHSPLTPEQLPRVGTLVVLGGGVSATASLPATSRLSQGSIRRLLEAVRLYHLMDQPTIVIAGGSGNPFVKVSESEIMRELLLILGIPDKRIVTEGESRDTYENAQALQRLDMRPPLILITTATHMGRSVRVFRALGMNPVPAPCDFRGQTNLGDPLRFLPSNKALAASTAAIYEYLGTWWYEITERI
ncbi:MAG: YdcF family protein [Deltaproteobacteria bacterium]|nr:MAG: YdcF family protein [Deltaproteobacteria bacterium]